VLQRLAGLAERDRFLSGRRTRPVKRGATWTAGTPTKLIEGAYFRGGGGNDSRMYDVSPDGKRFLMIKQEVSPNQPAPRIVVVQHWVEELKRLVPTK
jgi:hypothetical protein